MVVQSLCGCVARAAGKEESTATWHRTSADPAHPGSGRDILDELFALRIRAFGEVADLR